MGQDHSTPALRLRERKVTRKSNTSFILSEQKTIHVILEDCILSITIDDYLTCGWLLSETIRLYQGDKVIVALRTIENLDIIDEWLLRFEKSLKPLNDNEQLIVYFSEKSSGLNINCFDLIKTIGIGEYSKILLSRKKDNGILYALKALNKDEILNCGKIDQINAESNILSQLSHPFIIELLWSFQSVSYT